MGRSGQGAMECNARNHLISIGTEDAVGFGSGGLYSGMHAGAHDCSVCVQRAAIGQSRELLCC